MPNENEQLEQEQQEGNPPETQQINQQPESPAPSTVQFSEEQVQRAIAMSQRIANQAQADATAAREENERLRRQFEQRQVAPTYNFEEMNQRAANGQFAEVQVDVARQEMQRLIQPLLEENAASKRERNTISAVDKAIASHMHPDFVRPGREYLITYVRGALGNAEPADFVVKSLVDAAVGNAIAADPQKLVDFYAAQRANQNPQNQPPAVPPSQSKPIPPRIPNGRPIVNQGGKSILDESEKRLKLLLDPKNEITDEQFKEEMLNPEARFNMDLSSMRNTGATR